jgi:short-subunit dehydrogenase
MPPVSDWRFFERSYECVYYPASSGLGEALARAYAASGASLGLLGRRADALQA